GNVGHHMAMAFHESGIPIQQIFSRKKKKAKALAQLVNARPLHHLEELAPTADLYLLAVRDDAIESVAQQILSTSPDMANKLVAHTSGAVPGKVLQPYFKNYGVFYPLQSLSIDREVDFRQIPLCIDAAVSDAAKTLYQLAGRLSDRVAYVTDDDRKKLHVAAVLVNNFTNLLYTQAAVICEQEGLDFDLLKPLISETAAKIQQHDPTKMQTGPAARGDLKTIERHLRYLKKFPDIRSSYQLLSKLLLQQHKANKK
ncbi:MAG: Rossmann-like and DUF2520 domain-containing protein, partial [Bacteroidota bacterium]